MRDTQWMAPKNTIPFINRSSRIHLCHRSVLDNTPIVLKQGIVVVVVSVSFSSSGFSGAGRVACSGRSGAV